jgi:hypothetical protein
MRLSILAAGVFSFAMIVAGCGGSDDSSNGGGTGGTKATGGTSGGTGGSSGTGGSGTATGGTSGGTGGSGSTPGVTTYADVKPIFMAKCGACHVTGKQGAFFHTLAEKPDDATKDSSACPGKKKGECTLVRVKAGQMPAGAGCTGDPSKDAANEKCLTQAEQDKLQAWITGGLK